MSCYELGRSWDNKSKQSQTENIDSLTKPAKNTERHLQYSGKTPLTSFKKFKSVRKEGVSKMPKPSAKERQILYNNK